jgi:hypothetical protein
MGMRTQSLFDLESAIPTYVRNTGLLTDELDSFDAGASSGAILTALPQGGDYVNARRLPAQTTIDATSRSETDDNYNTLQLVRFDINQAIGAITKYDTGATRVGDPKILRGELYAWQGYAEILLADLFCSGIPLSTLDFEKDFTYRPGSSRDQVYLDAIAKEDSALALADTSTQVLNLARVLKARALLELDSTAAAAQIAALVPDGFQYTLDVNWHERNETSGDPCFNMISAQGTVGDREGRAGLPFLSSNDPRVTTIVTCQPNAAAYVSLPLTFPTKYDPTGFSPFPVADWIEARLIQAEAAQRASNPTGMLGLLNQLRTTATVPGQTTSLAGDLSDPGTDSARVALVFQERAYWLFLTGHRQGDLRRLLRHYPQWYRSQTQVYPTGAYSGFGFAQYGADITAPIPGKEFVNPLFHGCLNRAA